MEVIAFKLSTEYIELIKLLKLIGISESGAEAKLMVEEGAIEYNSKTEYQKRKKLRKGDAIYIANQNTKINII